MSENMAAEAAQDVRQAISRVFIKAPIETVWSELIRTDRPLPFFFNCQCDTNGLQVDAPMAMRTPNGANTMVVGKVTEFDPPYRYAHTFRFTTENDPPCLVRYLLEEKDGGTQFTLISEFPAGAEVTNTEKQMTSGGDFITKNFKAVVETGKASFSGGLMLFMLGLMAPLAPKAARSENWSLERIAKEENADGHA